MRMAIRRIETYPHVYTVLQNCFFHDFLEKTVGTQVLRTGHLEKTLKLVVIEPYFYFLHRKKCPITSPRVTAPPMKAAILATVFAL